MQYMILIYGCEANYANVSEAEMGQVYAEYMEYSKALVAAKAFVSGASLKEIATATTVRVKNGKTTTTDGPFAETKDLIAGWMVIDVDSYERAIELAGELSAAPGAGGEPIHEWLEVRPFLTAPPNVTQCH